MPSGQISQFKKRSGTLVDFDSDKIKKVIQMALEDDGKEDNALADSLTKKVVERLTKEGQGMQTSEHVQDLVELVLIDSGYSNTAKSLIIHRHENRKIKDEKKSLLNIPTLDPISKKFGLNSLRVLASRYLMKNSNGEIIETPTQCLERVATGVGVADVLYSPEVFDKNGGHENDIAEAQAYLKKLDAFDNKFYIGRYYLNKFHFRSLINHYGRLCDGGHMKVPFKKVLTMMATKQFAYLEPKILHYYGMMEAQDFLPNTPTIMNAGGKLGQLSACFVLDVEDNIEDIMNTAGHTAKIFQSGGGVGINYSKIRQEGAMVASTSGVASGPVSFMDIVNTVTDVVKQGGKRRGANMGIMEAWHPDIEQFITKKTEPGELENFNVSVGVWADLWDALKNGDEYYTLRDPRDSKAVGRIKTDHLIDIISHSAWKSGEPGLLFFDRVNQYNVFAKARGGPLRTTNPCGEQSLYPYESCNLGSINVSNMVMDGKFDWDKYESVIRVCARFLDCIIDVNEYPIPEIEKASLESRRTGLGVMGVADMLFKLGIPYNSKRGYELQDRLAEALTYYSMCESVEMSKERGPFPLCSKTEYPEGKIQISGYYEKPNHRHDWKGLIEQIKKHGIRNVLTTTVAPTGSLSMLAECSGGIEPVFAIAYEKHVAVGKFIYTNDFVKKTLESEGLYTDMLAQQIADHGGSLRPISSIPTKLKNLFVTAMDMHWADHLMAQATWQNWIGNAISKTVNMSHDTPPEDVKSAYLLAHELGAKGITVYRDGSRSSQVMHKPGDDSCSVPTMGPSKYVMEYIENNIKAEYVREQLSSLTGIVAVRPKAMKPKLSGVKKVMKEGNDLCPTCKSTLTFAEGCTMCVECGYSGCSSG